MPKQINAVKAHANALWLQRARKEGFKTERDLWLNWSPLLSTEALAVIFNCSSKTICNRMKKYGIKWTTKTANKKMIAELKEAERAYSAMVAEGDRLMERLESEECQ